jgi:hypothetical protein
MSSFCPEDPQDPLGLLPVSNNPFLKIFPLKLSPGIKTTPATGT